MTDFRPSKWLAKLLLCASASLAFATHAVAAQNCVAGTWQSPPNSLWDSTNGSFPVQAESAHFQMRWPADKPNLFSKEEAAAALKFFEGLFTWFTSAPINWPEPFCDSATKHKVQIFTNEGYPLTGSGAGERSQAMWVDAWRVKEGSLNRGWSRVAMVHEFTHTMQFSTRGMRNTDFGGWFWESHAEFMAHQYPDNDQKVGCTEMSAWLPHLYYGSTRNRYCNWQFWNHLKDKYGFGAVNNIWLNTVGLNGQDPFIALMRSQGWSNALLGDEFGQYAMKNVNWDYTDAQDGFNRGAAFRAHYGKNTDMKDWRSQARLAKLDPIDVSQRRFVVSKYFAPQRYGYNIVRLIPDAGATSITVNFRGVVQAAMQSGAEVGTSGALQPASVPKPGSNWRWGVVAIDSNGNSRASAMQRGVNADLQFSLQAGDQEVYLVVAATPDEHQSVLWDQRYHTLYRFPYKVQFAGAWPDGHQPGYQLATAFGYPAGRKHSNGGGWVADGAKVDATAYVGPTAAVLGGAVLGNARIEDHAAVWNGTVKDNAVVGGLTRLCDNVTVSGSAEVRSVMACNFDWNSAVSGTAKLFGDLEVRTGSTPVTAGAFSGIIYADMLSKAEFGATKSYLPIEVTAPAPTGWPGGSLPTDAVDCAAEWQTCQMPDSRSYTVYYGASGGYNTRAGVTGSVACTNAVFGDPLPGVAKRCYRKPESAVVTNVAPTASLTAPSQNASFTQGAVISFAATAGDVDGTVARVDLYDNGNLIGSSTVSPYRWTWGSATVGKHVFTVKATDQLGASTTSPGVTVNVNAPSASPPSGAVKCASQNGTCVLPAGKTATVWFGAWSYYKVRTGLSGNVACNATTFGGDPIRLVTKACYYVSN
jgi:Family of unknown function (DUF6055)/Bacterial Ig domain